MLTAQKVLDHYFLETRCMLLEIGATLDRFDRAPDRAGDERLEKIYRSLAILAERETTADRSERLLNLFSDPA